MSDHDLYKMSIVQTAAMKEIKTYTHTHPLFMSSPKYKDALVSHSIREMDRYIDDSQLPLSLLEIIDKELWSTINDPTSKYVKTKMKSARLKLMKFCVSSSVDIFIMLNCKPRSELLSNYKIKEVDKKKTAEIIDYVRSKPQPPQRTPEWYEFRNNLITASNAWKALKSKSSRTQLIGEKCKQLDISKYDSTNVNTNTAFHHGTKYEEISVMFYEYKYKTKVEDFGCIRHDTYHCLGASPDGINTSDTSPLFGRMLEIKNPVSREITGIPKEDYWIQMQLQMEVCNLDVCDFLETLIKEYDDEEDFIHDSFPISEEDELTGESLTPFTHTIKRQLKGIIMYFSGKNGPIYEYMPLYISKEQYETWSNEMFIKHKNITWLKNIYWYMKEYSCVVVERNNDWFQHAVTHILDTWEQVEIQRKKAAHKECGSTSRQRTRSRSGSILEEVPSIPSLSGCLLNIEDDDEVSVSVAVGKDIKNEEKDDEERKEEERKEDERKEDERKEEERKEEERKEEEEKEEEETNRKSECLHMTCEDTVSTISDIVYFMVFQCEEKLRTLEKDNIEKNLQLHPQTPPTSPESNCLSSSSSPLTRAAKKKRERSKKVENVIYVET